MENKEKLAKPEKERFYHKPIPWYIWMIPNAISIAAIIIMLVR